MLDKVRKQSCLQQKIILGFEQRLKVSKIEQQFKKSILRRQQKDRLIQDNEKQSSKQMEEDALIDQNIQLKIRIIKYMTQQDKKNKVKWKKHWLRTSSTTAKYSQISAPLNSQRAYLLNSINKYGNKQENKENYDSLFLKNLKEENELDLKKQKIWSQISYRSNKQLLTRLKQRYETSKEMGNIFSTTKEYYFDKANQIKENTCQRFRLKTAKIKTKITRQY